MKLVNTLLLLVLPVNTLCADASVTNTIKSINFENRSVGIYTEQAVRDDWGTVTWSNLGGRAQIVQDKLSGNVFRIFYPKEGVGPDKSGAQFVVKLPPSKELWFSYEIKFSRDFDFKIGGKLPGLTSGGGRYTGGYKPYEGQGWSARYMWTSGGNLSLYLYHVDMPGKWGNNLPLGCARITPGKWYRLTQHIKVNSNNNRDALLEVWLDNKLVLSDARIRLKLGDKGLIDSVFFSTFFGGNGKEWAPSRDGYIYFDNFNVSRSAVMNPSIKDTKCKD